MEELVTETPNRKVEPSNRRFIIEPAGRPARIDTRENVTRRAWEQLSVSASHRRGYR